MSKNSHLQETFPTTREQPLGSSALVAPISAFRPPVTASKVQPATHDAVHQHR